MNADGAAARAEAIRRQDQFLTDVDRSWLESRAHRLANSEAQARDHAEIVGEEREPAPRWMRAVGWAMFLALVALGIVIYHLWSSQLLPADFDQALRTK